MEVVYQRCGALDVRKENLAACVLVAEGK